MMMNPPMNELTDKIPSRYMLVNVVAQRARQIQIIAEMNNEDLQEKAVSIALREIANGEYSVPEL